MGPGYEDGEHGRSIIRRVVVAAWVALVVADMPGPLIAHMDGTAEADGLQGAGWGEFEARGTRDANGLDILVEKTGGPPDCERRVLAIATFARQEAVP